MLGGLGLYVWCVTEKLLIRAAPWFVVAALLAELAVVPSTGVFVESDRDIERAGEIERMMALASSVTFFKMGLKLVGAEGPVRMRVGFRLSSGHSGPAWSWSLAGMVGWWRWAEMRFQKQK